MKKKFDLQLFTVPTNETTTSDLAPAISVDYVSRITENIQTLQQILGIVDMEPMAVGTTIKMYTESVTLGAQVAEGEEINLSKATRVLAATKELTLGKYLKEVTAESIQKYGRDRAINKTDEKIVGEIRKGIKNNFFSLLATGTGTATAGASLQAALANVWAALQTRFDDMDVTPVYFVSSTDVAGYLGTANISTQTAFGFSYVEDFLGLGTVIINPNLTAGTVIGTVMENLNGAYAPATGGDLAEAFNLTSDESGLVGMTHQAKTGNASLQTLLFCSVLFYPEYLDGVIKGSITGA
jgi:hypothetical protein